VPHPSSVPVLEIEALTLTARHGRQQVPLVRDLNISLHPGEMLALVGESGSGKSLTASSVLGLLPNAVQVAHGQIRFTGANVLDWPAKRRRQLRGTEIGMVFQDYQGSFTPYFTIGNQLVETLRTHTQLSKAAARQMALEWLAQAALPAQRVYDSYPFQLSGGQRQRAAIACALMLEPKLLIADEPTTALDVLTGERVLDLLTAMQRQVGCAVLLISHDLRHVMKRADTIAVLKDGQLVESAPTATLQQQAQHPYTRQLLQARPSLAELQARPEECELV